LQIRFVDPETDNAAPSLGACTATAVRLRLIHQALSSAW